MPNRRDFLKAVAGGSAGLCLSGDTLSAQPARRQVTIGGRRVRVIDIHAHCVIPVEDDRRARRWRRTAARRRGNILGPQRLQLMDQQGVDVQALSINVYWWYAADRELARRIVQAQNEGLAKWVAAHPDRFVALASVALQHPDLAAEQLEDAVKRLGMRGASIGGHVNGEDLSLPKYDPFWAKAAELGVPVFMHPDGATNIIKDGALGGRGDLGNIIGNPLETTYFLSRLIFDGTLDRFPGLRVCARARRRLPAVVSRADGGRLRRAPTRTAPTRRSRASI